MPSKENSTISNIEIWFRKQKTQFISPKYQEIYLLRMSGYDFRKIGKIVNLSHERIRQIVFNIDQVITRDPLGGNKLISKNNYSFKKVSPDVFAANSLNVLFNGSVLYKIENNVCIPIDEYDDTINLAKKISSLVKLNTIVTISEKDRNKLYHLLKNKFNLSVVKFKEVFLVWRIKSRILNRVNKALSISDLNLNELVSAVLRDTRRRYSIPVDEDVLCALINSLPSNLYYISSTKNDNGEIYLSSSKKIKLLPVESKIKSLINNGIFERKGITDNTLKSKVKILESSIVVSLSYSPIFIKISRNNYGIVGYKGDQNV